MNLKITEVGGRVKIKRRHFEKGVEVKIKDAILKKV